MLWRVAGSKTGLVMLGRTLTQLSATACRQTGFDASGGYERKLTILLDRQALGGALLVERGVDGDRAAFAKSQHGARRVDDRRVTSGIIRTLKISARWCDSPADYGPFDDLW